MSLPGEEPVHPPCARCGERGKELHRLPSWREPVFVCRNCAFALGENMHTWERSTLAYPSTPA